MRRLALIVSILYFTLPTFAFPTCAGASQNITWWNSVTGDGPCALAEKLYALCIPEFVLPPLASHSDVYLAGDPRNYAQGANLAICSCNTVAYSLLSACMDCQRDTQDPGPPYADYLASHYQQQGWPYCDGQNNLIYNGTLPAQLLDLVSTMRIPSWAMLDVSGGGRGVWLFGAAREYAFDHPLTETQSASWTPTSWDSSSSYPTSPATTASNTPSFSSSPATDASINVAALAGGIGGGAAILLFGIGFGLIWSRRRRRRQQPSIGDDANTGVVRPSASNGRRVSVRRVGAIPASTIEPLPYTPSLATGTTSPRDEKSLIPPATPPINNDARLTDIIGLYAEPIASPPSPRPYTPRADAFPPSSVAHHYQQALPSRPRGLAPESSILPTPTEVLSPSFTAYSPATHRPHPYSHARSARPPASPRTGNESGERETDAGVSLAGGPLDRRPTLPPAYMG